MMISRGTYNARLRKSAMRRADGQTLQSTMYLWFGHDSRSVECTQYSAAGWRRAKQDKIFEDALHKARTTRAT